MATAPMSSPLLTEEKINIIIEGEKALLNAEWEKAYELLSKLCQRDSSDPTGYLFLAAAMQTEMIDREENFDKKGFTELLDKAKELAETALGDCTRRDSAYCYLILGHYHAYQAVWENRFGSKFSAVTHGFKAKGKYRKGLEIDSTMYDLYLGMGSYHYWKTVKSGILRLAGIFKDDRQKGIDEIRLTIDSADFSRETARSAMIWIYINEKRYDSAISLSKAMFKSYPDGNFFLWTMAQSYYEKKDFINAAETYDSLFNRLKSAPGKYFNIIESAYWLYQCYNELDYDDRANDVLAYVSSIYKEIPRSTHKKQKTKLAYLKRRF
jgi:hypothetical protein